MDGIDAALVSFDNSSVTVVGSLTTAYPVALRTALTRLMHPQARMSLHELASLNIEVGRRFGKAATALLQKTNFSAKNVSAIGSHGQTVRHSPLSDPPYSVQIGDAATIATLCGIKTVTDFRSMDLAAGGEGAPLVPAFHEWSFRDNRENRAVLNIGGIANITILPADNGVDIQGFDTGPGNCLMDEWSALHLDRPYDEQGRWAASGSVSKKLLASFLADPYFKHPPPKSTGREYFNLDFIRKHLMTIPHSAISERDVQATLARLTIDSIVHSVDQVALDFDRLLVAGGGANNPTLMAELNARFPATNISSTRDFGVDPDMLEAVAFAWLAKRRIELKPVPVTTGSRRRTHLLGAVYDPAAGHV